MAYSMKGFGGFGNEESKKDKKKEKKKKENTIDLQEKLIEKITRVFSIDY